MRAWPRPQRGLTLIELMAAVAIGAIVLAALNSLVRIGINAQTAGQGANELSYQARFALERMATAARNATPILLVTPTAGTTGDWFAPVMYCLNANSQLIETTTTDTGCTGTTVIANKVSAFSAQAPSGAGTGPVDDPVANLSLALTDAASNNSVTLATSVRLGGGTQ
jgi:prepilin-type N-terminal cleavage/methylation domain-containing protein